MPDTAKTVYPTPQQMNFAGDTALLTHAVIVAPGANSETFFAAQLFSRWVAEQFLINLPIAESASPGQTPIIIGTFDEVHRPFPDRIAALDVPTHPEGYALSVAPAGILAVGRDRQGSLYAVATMMQLLQRHENNLSIPGVKIRDWPRFPVRYVHLYLPSRENIPFFRRYVREFLLRYKFNGIILEIGGGVRLTRHPEIATGWNRTVHELRAHGDQIYTIGESAPLGPAKRFQNSTHHGLADGRYLEPEELRELVAFARALGQEVVPEIQSLSHVYYLACAHREIAELPAALFPDAYCPCNDESYKLLFEVMDEIVEIMTARTVHIGHDEWRAGGLCPSCRGKDTGDLFAQDVIRIHHHLQAKNVGVWMWGDHFVSGHNETGRSGNKEGPVWYDYPSTAGASEKVQQACPNIILTHWSWSLRNAPTDPPDIYDRELHDKGFRFLYGNFDGLAFENWPQRSAAFDVLGAEISSWCTMEEFQIGKMHVPAALASINLLWSSHYPPQEDAIRHLCGILPDVARRLKGAAPDIRLIAPHQETVDLSNLFNTPLKAARFDLSGLRRGPSHAGDLTYALGDGAIITRRQHQPPSAGPDPVTIPLHGCFAALTFLQSSVGIARPNVHAGDATFFPVESSELIGIYDIVFRDGLILQAQVRAGENVGPWDAGLPAVFYHARNIEAGELPDGSPLVIWAHEWRNPRPDQPLLELRFRGAAGPSDAQPLLLAITTTRKDQLRDFRPPEKK